jgi:aspartate racemase
MKTIGLIGGTSWVSTLEYYRFINQFTNERLGGTNSARLLLYSVNHAEFMPTVATDWDETAVRFSAIAQNLEKAGADCLLLCANTLHIMAEPVAHSLRIPLIHIATETSAVIKKQKLKKVGLLGTRFTMEKPFFKDKLLEDGIDTIIPDPEDRDFIHTSILTELGKGIFTAQTKERYITIINKLSSLGAEGVILGCTEIPILIKQEDSQVPVFDTTAIHSKAAVEFALGKIVNHEQHADKK